jgi:hypothetical protein
LENLIATETARAVATATRRPNATANGLSFTYIDRSKAASLERVTLPNVRFDGRFLTQSSQKNVGFRAVSASYGAPIALGFTDRSSGAQVRFT